MVHNKLFICANGLYVYENGEIGKVDIDIGIQPIRDVELVGDYIVCGGVDCIIKVFGSD
jgi:hypothetical protein